MVITTTKVVKISFYATNGKTGELIERDSLNDLIAAVEWNNISDNYNYDMNLKMKDWDFGVEFSED